MNITNIHGLPAALVTLVSQGEREYQPDAISVTTLIRPPQQVALERKHWDEIEEDASDRLWMTYGSLVHMALERMESDNALVEERLEIECENWRVHGTPDLYEGNGVLTDFKFVSVWSSVDGAKQEWVEQLNCYAELLRQHGFPVKKAQVVAIYRDWSKNKALSGDHPKQQVAVLPVHVFDHYMTFIGQRVRLHQHAAEGRWVECSPEERWEKPTVYALTKKGNKRATRIYASRDEAEAGGKQIVQIPELWEHMYEVQERPGESTRCESYCRVARFCKQYQAMRDV